MNELELRWRTDDLSAVRGKAESLGFAFSSEKQQKDTYYLNGAIVDGKRRWLRVREADTVSIDFHTELSMLECEELEVPTQDAAKAHALLCALGYTVQIVVDKHRVQLEREGFNLTLDTIAGLGSFCEIETFGNGSAEIEGKIRAIAEDLGLTDEVSQMTYPEMVEKLMTD